MIIEPLAGALGAEIRGVSLAGLDEDAWREIRRAFLEYAVLVFRDQALEPADLMRVGARFGEPCFYPFVTGMDGYPYIFEVVKAENGRPISAATGTATPPISSSRRSPRCCTPWRRLLAAATRCSRAPAPPTTRSPKACAGWSTGSSASTARG